MDRIHSFEKIVEMISKSDKMSEKEKSDYLETYKKIYYLWLDELKIELNDYEPSFVDLSCDSSSFNYSKHNLKGEIWKKIDQVGYSRYEISNLGRVKYLGNIVPRKNKFQNGKECIGYLVLDKQSFQKNYPSGTPCGFSQKIPVYTLVALAFLDKTEGDGYHVHHITNNGYDNEVNNLVLLTPEEHSYVHGFKIGKNNSALY